MAIHAPRPPHPELFFEAFLASSYHPSQNKKQARKQSFFFSTYHSRFHQTCQDSPQWNHNGSCFGYNGDLLHTWIDWAGRWSYLKQTTRAYHKKSPNIKQACFLKHEEKGLDHYPRKECSIMLPVSLDCGANAQKAKQTPCSLKKKTRVILVETSELKNSSAGAEGEFKIQTPRLLKFCYQWFHDLMPIFRQLRVGHWATTKTTELSSCVNPVLFADHDWLHHICRCTLTTELQIQTGHILWNCLFFQIVALKPPVELYWYPGNGNLDLCLFYFLIMDFGGFRA